MAPIRRPKCGGGDSWAQRNFTDLVTTPFLWRSNGSITELPSWCHSYPMIAGKSSHPPDDFSWNCDWKKGSYCAHGVGKSTTESRGRFTVKNNPPLLFAPWNLPSHRKFTSYIADHLYCSYKSHWSNLSHWYDPSHSAFCGTKITWSTVLCSTGRNGLHGDIN